MLDPKPELRGVFARIVVGVDAQGTSDHALRTAYELAAGTGARLTLVHGVGTSVLDWTMVDDPRLTAKDAGLVEQATRATLRHVTSVIGETLPNGKPVGEAVVVETGVPARILLAEAQRQDADLVVLGYDIHHSRPEFGRTVKHVIAGAPKAVWLQKHTPSPLRRILVAVDLSQDSLLALANACTLARGLGARVTAFNAFSSAGYVVSSWPDYPDLGALVAIDELRDAQERDLARQLAGFDWRGVEHVTRFVQGDPALAILDAQRDADLIVMGTHGRTGLAAAFLGSVSAHVVRAAHLPVLVVRHPEREFAHQHRPARPKA
jgi:nucleotide-binding universal stress UspA family protein